MGVRITPVNHQPVHVSDHFFLQATSAESNVLTVSAALGERVKVLTTFVKDSPIAFLIKNDLRKRGVEFEGKDVPQGGPWGYRHQFNIADTGYGVRGPRVPNDRAGEVGRTLHVKDFDLERLFGREGVRVLHVSGLIAALSPETGQFCIELARAAKSHGTLISFDLNYRESFWKGRGEELHSLFTEIASLTDYLIGNERISSSPSASRAGGRRRGHRRQDGQLQGHDRQRRKAFPNASVFATTLRQVVHANEHLWGAILIQTRVVQARPGHPHFDRIGGGDGFVGGLLYGLNKGWEPEKALQFGWATGAMATTMIYDFAVPASEEQVWSVWEGNARVKR
jgi:2-dehydro-3-deoxygluconokinase